VKNVEVVGNREDPRTSAFEVTDDIGTTYWSKLQSAKFPDFAEVAQKIADKFSQK